MRALIFGPHGPGVMQVPDSVHGYGRLVLESRSVDRSGLCKVARRREYERRTLGVPRTPAGDWEGWDGARVYKRHVYVPVWALVREWEA